MEFFYDFSRYYEKESANQSDHLLLSGHVGRSWRTQSGAVIETVFLTLKICANVTPHYLLCVTDILGLVLNGWQADQVSFSRVKYS